MSRTRPNRAPLIIFGGIALIGFSGLSVVVYSHCNRSEPYLDPVIMSPDNPHRLDHKLRKGLPQKPKKPRPPKAAK